MHAGVGTVAAVRGQFHVHPLGNMEALGVGALQMRVRERHVLEWNLGRLVRVSSSEVGGGAGEDARTDEHVVGRGPGEG